jgi:hypothetical protein
LEWELFARCGIQSDLEILALDKTHHQIPAIILAKIFMNDRKITMIDTLRLSLIGSSDRNQNRTLKVTLFYTDNLIFV